MTNTKMEDVLIEVKNERELQDVKWGGPEHDDQNTDYDFLFEIEDKFSKACAARSGSDNNPQYRRRLLQISALAVAAIESSDRKVDFDAKYKM